MTDNFLPPPDPDDFYVEPDIWRQVIYAVCNEKSMLFIGPTGSGKTELASRVARGLKRPLESFNFGAMSEPRSSLIGVTHLDPRRGTWFAPSRFVEAFQQPQTVILLDEISRAGRDAFNVLLPVLDNQAYLALDESETGEVVERAAGVAFLATANIGLGYTGAEHELDLALMDRMEIVVQLSYPDPAQEVAILLRRCTGLKPAAAKRLVRLAGRQREMAAEGEFVGAVSTRQLLAAGQQLAAGIGFENAFRFCILNRFSREGGVESEREKLKQIYQKLSA